MLFVIHEQRLSPKYSQAGFDALSTALAFGQQANLLLVPRKTISSMTEIDEAMRTQLHELGLREAHILGEANSNQNDTFFDLRPLDAKQVSACDYRKLTAQHKFVLSF